MLSIEDFGQRYVNTYVRWKYDKSSPAVVAFVARIHGAGSTGIIEIQARHASGVVTYPAELDKLNVDLPDAGFFMNNGHALYLFRYPERQWKRGLCSANAEIYNPFLRLFHSGIYQCGFGYKSVQAAFSGDHISDISKAVDKFDENGVMSVPITRSIMLSRAPIKRYSSAFSKSKCDLIVWFGLNPVGWVNLSTNKFEIQDQTFEQEVRDELRNIGQSKWTNY